MKPEPTRRSFFAAVAGALSLPWFRREKGIPGTRSGCPRMADKATFTIDGHTVTLEVDLSTLDVWLPLVLGGTWHGSTS